MKEKILVIIGAIILAICVLLAGCIDSEANRYIESTSEATMQNSMIRQ